MLTNTITIDGKEVPFRASAAVPRIYRHAFHRDIMQDMNKLHTSFAGKVEEGNELDRVDLEIFENLAFVMAKHADPTIPPTADEWLEQFNTFSIYEILPHLLALWAGNMQTQAESKKNLMAVVQ